MSECDKNVDNYYGRNFEYHTVPAERLSTVSSPFLGLFCISSVLILIKSSSRMQKICRNLGVIEMEFNHTSLQILFKK